MSGATCGNGREKAVPDFARSSGLQLLFRGICRAVDELQSRAVGIAEVRPRPVDGAAAAVLLEKNLDPFGAQAIDRSLVVSCVDHESVMHPVRHLKRTFHD